MQRPSCLSPSLQGSSCLVSFTFNVNESFEYRGHKQRKSSQETLKLWMQFVSCHWTDLNYFPWSQLPVFLHESELMCLWLTVQTSARQLYTVNRKWILVRHRSCVTFCSSFTNPVTAPFICFMHCLEDMYSPCPVFTVIHVEQIIYRMYCFEI